MIMLISRKVMLHPNNRQETILWKYANAARFAYNWAVGREEANYANGGHFIGDTDLRKEFTLLKKQPGYEWLNDVSCDVAKQAIKDAVKAYRNFFAKRARKPRFKSKYHSKPSFYQDPVKLQVYEQHVKLVLVTDPRKSKSRRGKLFSKVKLAEKSRIPADVKYLNPRISYDGLHWWISVSIEIPDPVPVIPESDGIGIDIGIKSLAVSSDGTEIQNVNKTGKVTRLQKRKKHLQRNVSRKHENNKKKGGSCRKSKNERKSLKLLLATSRKIKNIQDNHIRKSVKKMLRKRPAFIALEDLNVSGMLKNRRLARAVQEEKFRALRDWTAYRAAHDGIPVTYVPRWYPSSKTCSVCGYVDTGLTLSDRTFACPSCGNVMDRDLNASINIREYARKILMSAAS